MKEKARGCFGTETIDTDTSNIENRPKEKIRVKGLTRRKNYIYKNEEIKAAKFISEFWSKKKLQKQRRELFGN